MFTRNNVLLAFVAFDVLVGIYVVIFLIFGREVTIRGPEALQTKEDRSSNVEFIPEIPTIASIFAEDHSWTATLSADKKRVLLVTGDIIPARSVNFQTVTRNDFTWPYHKIADVLKDADITFVNLETPLLRECPLTQSGMIFCGDARNVEGLVFAGVDIVSLANNHAGNHGVNGVRETKDLLQKKGIIVTGLGTIEVMTLRGTKFAFLGYNDISKDHSGTANADTGSIAQDIALAKKSADVVVVTYHWGVEYRAQPDERQKYLGRFTIDAGADLVIGNHPHWIQPVEIYKGKLITYAHGNFIFDQEWSLKTKQGVVGKYTFYDDTLVDVIYSPILIEAYGQPHFLTGDEKQQVLEDMQRQSELLSSL